MVRTKKRQTGRNGRNKASKRDADAMLARRREVALLRAQGKSQNDIAKTLGCHRNTVCTDMKANRQEWLDKRLESMDEIIAEERELLHLMRQEMLDAYFNAENRHGEKKQARYAEVALRATERLHALLQLDDPEAFRQRRMLQSGSSEVDVEIVEVVVEDREQLASFRGEDGIISVAAFKRLVTVSSKGQPDEAATP